MSSSLYLQYSDKSVNRNEELRAATGLPLEWTPHPKVKITTKKISPPPVYHPSVGGKFLASGPPPPPRNRPFTGGKGPLVEKPRPKPKSSAGGKGPRIDKVRAPAKPKISPVKKQTIIKAVSAYAVTKDMMSGTKFKKVASKAINPETCGRPALKEVPRTPYLAEYASGPKGSKWTQYEHEALYLLLVLQRNDEIEGDLKIRPLMDATLFGRMSNQLESLFNIVRTEYSARGYWNRYGRQKAGWDERIDTWPGRELVTSAQGSKAASSPDTVRKLKPAKVTKRSSYLY
ncbi:hypothetical protein VTL71DRAFT_8180 [Oculimacula yallundae]|uniref:Uncharacterized protein n=1 Tax=Oculimacula yallundae TaxID=86028 RepID=A0ABR4CXU8_9HELO